MQLVGVILFWLSIAILVFGTDCIRACLDMGDNRIKDWAATVGILAVGAGVLAAAIKMVG